MLASVVSNGDSQMSEPGRSRKEWTHKFQYRDIFQFAIDGDIVEDEQGDLVPSTN